MKARPNHCCPVCGHPVGVKRWFWRAWLWARWNCPSCGTLLRFDFRQRLWFALRMGLIFWTALGIGIGCIALGISPWIWTVPLLAAVIFGLIYITLHGDRIAVATPGKQDGSHSPPNHAGH